MLSLCFIIFNSCGKRNEPAIYFHNLLISITSFTYQWRVKIKEWNKWERKKWVKCVFIHFIFLFMPKDPNFNSINSCISFISLTHLQLIKLNLAFWIRNEVGNEISQCNSLCSLCLSWLISFTCPFFAFINLAFFNELKEARKGQSNKTRSERKRQRTTASFFVLHFNSRLIPLRCN